MLPSFLLLAQLESNAQQVGRAFGVLFWACLSIAVIIKCLRIKKRETTNSAAVTSLLLFFAVMLESAILQAVENFAHNAPSWLIYARTTISVIGLIASVVFGIIGLTQIHALKERFNQGRAQAGWGIGLSSVMLGAIVIMSIFVVRARLAGTDIIAEMQDAKSESSTSQSISQQTRSESDYVVNEEFNYRFANPERPWSPMDPEKLNPAAKTSYFKPRPSSFIMILPEVFGVETLLTTDTLIEVVRANLYGVATDVQFTDIIDETVNGIPGKRVSATCRIAMSDVAYSYWATTYNGYGYQVIAAIQDGSVEQAEKLGKQITQNFEILDKEHFAHDDALPLIEPFSDENLNYSIDLTREGWVQWTEGEVEAPEGEFVASFENAMFLFLTSASYETLNPSYQELKLAYLKNSFFVEEDEIEVHYERQVETEAGPAFEFSFTVGNDELKNRVTARIHKLDNFSVFSSVYFDEDYATEAYLKKTQDSLDRLRLSPDTPDLLAHRATLNASQHKFQERVLNDIGINYYQRGNYQEAERYFEKSFARTESDSVILGNQILALDHLGEHVKATMLFEEWSDTFTDNYDTISYAAEAYYNADDLQNAERLYSKIFADGYADEDALLEYLNVLIDLERRPEAIEFTRGFIERNQSWRARRWLGSMLGDAGEFDAAMAVLNDLKTDRSFDRQIDLDLAETEYKFEKYNQLIERVNRLEDQVSKDSRFLILRGKALYQLDFYARAKRDFEAALQLDPSDADTQEWLAYTSNALGLGDHEVTKEPIAPIELSEEILAEILKHDSEKTTNSETHYEYSIIAYKYEPETIHKKTIFESVYIGDDASLEQFQTLSIHYDPFAEKVFMNSVEVLDAEGKILAKANLEDYYVTSDTGSDMAIEDKVLHCPVPGLQIGNTVRFTYTRLRQGAPDRMPFEGTYFIKSKPMTVRAVVIDAPKSSFDYKSNDALEIIERENKTIWIDRDTPAYVWEPYQDDFDNYVPQLSIGASAQDWRKLSEEYLEQIENSFVLDEATRTFAKEIAGSLETDSDKAYSVYRYIQKNYTYKAIEFGPRARIPNSADKVIANKYGDCKDLALLAHQLLDTVGVRSHLALVNSRDTLVDSIPSMDQFDHMILYLPDIDGGRFIDCTSKEASPKLVSPLGLEEQIALVLDPEEPQLVEIPQKSRDENKIIVDRDIEVEGHSLLVKETFTATGSLAAYFRSYLKSIETSKRADALQEHMAELDSSIRLKNFEYEGLDDTMEDLQLKFEYTSLDRVESAENGEVLVRLPNIWEKDYFAVNYLQNRKSPFKVRIPIELDGTVRLRHKADLAPAVDPNSWKKRESNAYHNVDQSLTPNADGSLTFSHKLVLKPGTFPREDYPAFLESAQKTLSSLSRSIRFVANE